MFPTINLIVRPLLLRARRLTKDAQNRPKTVSVYVFCFHTSLCKNSMGPAMYIIFHPKRSLPMRLRPHTSPTMVLRLRRKGNVKIIVRPMATPPSRPLHYLPQDILRMHRLSMRFSGLTNCSLPVRITATGSTCSLCSRPRTLNRVPRSLRNLLQALHLCIADLTSRHCTLVPAAQSVTVEFLPTHVATSRTPHFCRHGRFQSSLSRVSYSTNWYVVECM